MNKSLLQVALLTGGILASSAAVADHEGRFDFEKSFTLAGSLAKVSWTNPRVYLYVDVKNDGGAVDQWTVMTGSPTQLASAGITDRSQLVLGGQYQLEVNPERKAGSRTVFLTRMVFSNGRVVKLGM